MDSIRYLFVIILGIVHVNSELYPIDQIKCKLDDAECMRNSIQKVVPSFMAGVPELGVEVLDIMNLDMIKFDISGLKFSLKDGNLQGMKDLDIKNVKWDLDKKKVDVTYHVNCTLTGHYTASGQILILPITGDGPMRLKLRNAMVKITLNYNLKKKDEKSYVNLTKFSFTFDVLDNANYYLGNLFNGNKELGKAMHTFLNDNWKLITKEFGTPIIQAIAEKLFKNCNILFSQLPINEISLSY